MNRAQLLGLLLKSLRAFQPSALEDLGALADDLDSLRASLPGCSHEFNVASQQLWEALEVIAVTHQEQGTSLSEHEKRDLRKLTDTLITQTNCELERQPSPDSPPATPHG
jgi:hypothetical protein